MKVLVIGNGGWGTALAMTLDRNGHDVTVWGPFDHEIEAIKSCGENEPYLKGVTLPSSLNWTTDRSVAKEAELIVLVPPSRFLKTILKSFKEFIPASALIVSATKGFDEETFQRMSETAEGILGHPIAVLSGPSHAEEVARLIPTAVTIAHQDLAQAEKIQALFMGERFRAYTSTDVIGLELGGALKNVIAIAAGINDGMGLGDNSKAALMTRGLGEIARLADALGANPKTISGLSGMGDLIVTCASQHSRNRSVGERLGKGESLTEIMDSMKMVAEGVWNTAAAKELADKTGVEMPIVQEVYKVIHQEKDPRKAVLDLMGRTPKPEHN